jgi:hypothetical protein
MPPSFAQGAAEVGGAVDADGRLLELNANAPWRQALLKKLTLAANDKKSNLQVRGVYTARLGPADCCYKTNSLHVPRTS